jgi:transposase
MHGFLCPKLIKEGTVKKLTRRPTRFKGYTFGLDVHQGFIKYVLLDVRGDEECGGRVAATIEGLSKLLALKKGSPAQYVLEAGGSFLWVFDLLVAHAGRERVHVAQPHRIHPIANSLEKNDDRDAWWLAYLQFEGRLPEAWVPEGLQRDLRIACRELRDVVDRRSDLIRRFKSHLTQEGLKIGRTSFHSEAARDQAAELARSRSGARRWALEHLISQIEVLDEEVEWWRERVREICDELPQVKAMEKEIPGIGPETAAIVYGELGDPTRYRSAKAYASATGLVPGFRISGGRSTRTGMSRAGSRHARWALTRAVIACMRCKRGPGVSVKYWVLRRIRFRPKRTVYVAAARKLAEGIWRLFALGEEFDLSRAFPGRRVEDKAA